MKSINIICFCFQPSFMGSGRAWFMRKESKRKYEAVPFGNTFHQHLKTITHCDGVHFSYFALQLLDYVSTAIFFSDKNVDSNLVAWNRVVLLHGEAQ